MRAAPMREEGWRLGGQDGRAARRALLALVVALAPGPTLAAEALKVRVQEGQSLRDIAREHLGDPNLWTEILRANGLASVTDVRPGVELTIPTGEIAEASRALRKALATIQRATEEGARLFAAAEIEQGLKLYEEAVAGRRAGRWAEAARRANEATSAASQALLLATKQRDAAAEARLSDREGWVEGRKPQELVWTDRAVDAVLIEAEKVRTLSQSSAQITFRDDSRLRLSANSQAVIQRMRVDPLSRREEAKVSLVEGDFYALLSGKSERKKFEVEVPEVRTDVDSRNFWVRRDETGAKFTNYDDRVLEVAAHGGEVALGRNEGTLVRSGRAPSGKIGVLGAAELQEPADNGQVFSAEVPLAWAPLPDATGYWLELAHDPAFQRLEGSRWGVRGTSFAAGPLDVGTYYWRIAALDKFGLPGERSAVWRFHVRVDRTPPYLTLQEPPEIGILRASPVRVQGETEPSATLRLNGAELTVGGDGRFAAELAAQPGENTLHLEATDAAGNVTRRSRTFLYEPDERAALRFDDAIPRRAPRDFVTDREVISLAGTIDPGAQLLVRAADGELRASSYAAADGRFALNLPLRAPAETFEVEVVQRSGFASRDRFSVAQDEEPPPIELEVPPPAVTAVEWLPLRGRAEGAVTLTVNGRPARLADGRFDETVSLREGANAVELVATDLVGNTRIERFAVDLDQVPPSLEGFSVSPRRIRSGQPVTIEVTARDASGLRKAAPVRIRVAGTDYTDFLELGGAAGTYRKAVLLPDEAAGAVAVREVEVEDYAGNKARFTLDR
jgi:hypothetical protein